MNVSEKACDRVRVSMPVIEAENTCVCPDHYYPVVICHDCPQVKDLRSKLTEMLDPFLAAASTRCEGGILEIYKRPDIYTGLNDYAKALEYAESSLLGGFFFKHFLLACNVIGVDAKGTMNRAVKALKYTFETPLFPVLDKLRSDLGRDEDARLIHM